MRGCNDYCKRHAERYKAIGEAGQTAHTVLIKGYVTERDLPYLEKQLNKQFTVVIEAEDADNEKAPVVLKNNAFARPAESLVKMYSLPGAHDIDPTPITGFFYYLFFGMMFSDAGLRTYYDIGNDLCDKKLHPSPSRSRVCAFSATAEYLRFCGGLCTAAFSGIA